MAKTERGGRTKHVKEDKGEKHFPGEDDEEAQKELMWSKQFLGLTTAGQSSFRF